MTPIRPLGVALAGAALAIVLQAPVPARAADPAGTYTLSKVTFQGNAQVPTAELQAALPIQPGETIDHAGLQQDADAVAAVYQKHNVGAHMTTRLTVRGKTRAEVTYSFAEQAAVAPIVQHIGVTADSVSVTGNSKVSTADILAAANIKPGQEVTNPEISAAQAAIVALYKKANVGVSVSTDWTNVSPQHVAMTFKVGEKTDQ